MTDAPLRWSTEAPKEPGVYRVKSRDTYGPGNLCEIGYDNSAGGRLRICLSTSYACYVDIPNGYEWSQRFVPETDLSETTAEELDGLLVDWIGQHPEGIALDDGRRIVLEPRQ